MFDSRPQAALRWRRSSQKASGIIPPNAKGKSSFHWLILNVTSMCIIVDLREDVFLQTVGEYLDAHKPTMRWSSSVGTLRIKGLKPTGSISCEHVVDLKEWTFCAKDKKRPHTVLLNKLWNKLNIIVWYTMLMALSVCGSIYPWLCPSSTLYTNTVRMHCICWGEYCCDSCYTRN